MAYDVSDHPLRSEAVTALSDEVFSEQQAWAEDLLGVAGTSYTGRNKERIRRAIVRQMNWQLLLPSSVWYTKQASSSQSRQNVTYKDNITLVDPYAAALVAMVEADEEVESRYGDMRSIR